MKDLASSEGKPGSEQSKSGEDEGVGNKECWQGQSGACKLKYDEVCKGQILKIPAGRPFQGNDCDSPGAWREGQGAESGQVAKEVT